MRQVFADESITAVVVLGEREPAKQLNQGPGRANRVVFAPGDESGGAGEYAAARNPGRNPRPVRTLVALSRVYVWAYDGAAPNSEEAQYEAVWVLHDRTISAIHRKAHGTYQVTAPRWTNKVTERAFGKELVFMLQLEVPILERPIPTAPGIEPVVTTRLAASPDDITGEVGCECP
ncbi:hypothetical protein [Chondromyces crocatus]|uniref:hypothetical protein n=1 Tax=Chondromyces crocatus TaxID=52 RepID=UPI0012E2BE57|nr:hypothetical protein [Chondromyces crocatus]